MSSRHDEQNGGRSADKPAKLPGRPFQPGPDPRRGHGPAPGHGGRPPWAFKDEMERALIEGKAGLVVQKMISGDIVEQLAADADGSIIVGVTRNADRLNAIKFAASYAPGLPVQVVAVEAHEVWVIRAPPRAQTAEEWLAQREREGR